MPTPHKPKGPPPNATSLLARIRNLAKRRETTEQRITVAVCNTAISQMLPPGVIKGGTAMKLRIGEAGSRFTPDVDGSRRADMALEDYLDALEKNLRSGWGGFTGRLVHKKTPEPAGVPKEYVMRPFEVKLSYKGDSIKTLDFELGRDEVGSTETAVVTIATDILELFGELELPLPNPVPLLATEHQIAQKLHACSTPNVLGTNDRAHDLVDLQLLVETDPPDLETLNEVGSRLFAARRAGEWPPEVRLWPEWDGLYAEAADGLQVLSNVSEAVDWANKLVKSAVEAGEAAPAATYLSR
ncbi:MAG TPA: nucleotidyl transferase AbiEii/AbiGii toxin family protein [Acidimicrobiales bacterium]|nr:nucleotidyl transferase AbiEii/AbiGii toxin family protein [Acidimicrobiales bacterium]